MGPITARARVLPRTRAQTDGVSAKEGRKVEEPPDNDENCVVGQGRDRLVGADAFGQTLGPHEADAGQDGTDQDGQAQESEDAEPQRGPGRGGW